MSISIFRNIRRRDMNFLLSIVDELNVSSGFLFPFLPAFAILRMLQVATSNWDIFNSETIPISLYIHNCDTTWNTSSLSAAPLKVSTNFLLNFHKIWAPCAAKSEIEKVSEKCNSTKSSGESDQAEEESCGKPCWIFTVFSIYICAYSSLSIYHLPVFIKK